MSYNAHEPDARHDLLRRHYTHRIETMMLRRTTAATAAAAVAATTLLLLGSSNAFVASTNQFLFRSTTTTTTTFLTPEDERAQALSGYLSRAHQEKLAAIQELERKKAAEIEYLLQQLEELRQEAVMASGAGVGAVPPVPPLPQQQVLLPTAQRSTTAASVPPSFSNGSMLYNQRNAKVTQAGQQSRWSDAEVRRVSDQGRVGAAPSSRAAGAAAGVPIYKPPTPPLQTASSFGSSSPTTANEGLSASYLDAINGSINGARAGAPPAPLAASPPALATRMTSGPVPPQVHEADHGLRSDGGVGGLSLAERVLNGASAGPSPPPPPPSSAMRSPPKPVVPLGPGPPQNQPRPPPATTPEPQVTGDPHRYYARNVQVATAAQAGKSRWGPAEVARASFLAANSNLSPVRPREQQQQQQQATAMPPAAVRAPSPAAASPPLTGGNNQQYGPPRDQLRPPPAETPLPQYTGNLPMYVKRNRMLVMSAQAGRPTRWGPAEMAKATHLANTGSGDVPPPAQGQSTRTAGAGASAVTVTAPIPAPAASSTPPRPQVISSTTRTRAEVVPEMRDPLQAGAMANAWMGGGTATATTPSRAIAATPKASYASWGGKQSWKTAAPSSTSSNQQLPYAPPTAAPVNSNNQQLPYAPPTAAPASSNQRLPYAPPTVARASSNSNSNSQQLPYAPPAGPASSNNQQLPYAAPAATASSNNQQLPYAPPTSTTATPTTTTTTTTTTLTTSALPVYTPPPPANVRVLPSTNVTPDSLYARRNAKVAAAARAGKSRWGSMENDKALASV